MSSPPTPLGLSAPGRALWKDILSEYWMDEEPDKLAILFQLCKVTDRIAELEVGMTGQPLTVLGSARQMIVHPLIAEIRAQQSLSASLVKSLSLPTADSEAVEDQKKLTRSQQARAAANARWSKRYSG